jgi:hypothetical protein
MLLGGLDLLAAIRRQAESVVVDHIHAVDVEIRCCAGDYHTFGLERIGPDVEIGYTAGR